MAGIYDRVKAVAGVVLKKPAAAIFVIVLLIAVAIPLYENWNDVTRIHISDPHYPEELAKRGFNAKSFIENVKRELEAIENTDREKISLTVNAASFDVSIPGTGINVFDFVRSLLPFNRLVYIFPEIINEEGTYKISIGNAERKIPDLVLSPHRDTIAALHQAARHSAEEIALYATKGEALPRVQLAIAYQTINTGRPYKKKRYKKLLKDVITSTAFLVPEGKSRDRTAAIAYKYLGDISYSKARHRNKKSLYKDAIRFYKQALGADKNYARAAP